MTVHLSMNQVAQTAHFFIGMVFVLLPVVWGWNHAALMGSVACLLFALMKEFWWDLRYEDEMTSGGVAGGWQDFSWYLIGVVVANVLVLI